MQAGLYNATPATLALLQQEAHVEMRSTHSIVEPVMEYRASTTLTVVEHSVQHNHSI